jgi:hypothetical protein
MRVKLQMGVRCLMGWSKCFRLEQRVLLRMVPGLAP